MGYVTLSVSSIYDLPLELTNKHKLWDIVSGVKAFDITQSLTSAKDIAKSLVETAVSSAECQDNVTVIVLLL